MTQRLSFFISTLSVLLFLGAGCASAPADAPEMPTEDATNDMGEETSTMEDTDEPIKIGFLGPLTGDVANIGTGFRDAVKLATDEVNEAGGIDGRTVEVIYEDGKCDPKQASTAANKLINVDSVVAIVGGLCSGESSAAAPLAEEKEVVMLSPASTAPDLTDAGDYFFRVVPSDAYQGGFVAQYAFNELGKTKVAILHSLTDYTQGIAQVFEREFTALGGEVVVKDTFTQGSKDLRTQLTKIKNSDAEFIYFLAYTESGVVGLRQMQELDVNLPVLGGDTFSDPAIQEAQGAEGVTFFQAYTAESAAFTEKFLAATGRDEQPPFSAQAYDAATLLFSVMNDGNITGESMKEALYALERYEGVSGPISFDENGDLGVVKFSILRIEDGKGMLVE